MPSAAQRRAKARPMPDAAPVITAPLPLRVWIVIGASAPQTSACTACTPCGKAPLAMPLPPTRAGR